MSEYVVLHFGALVTSERRARKGHAQRLLRSSRPLDGCAKRKLAVWAQI